MANSQESGQSLQPAVLLAAAGIALLCLSWAGAFPMTLLARSMSEDGILSEHYRTLLCRSQWTLASVLLAVAVLFPVIARYLPAAIRLFLSAEQKPFMISMGFAAFVLTLAVQVFLFDNIPHMTDAIAHLFQAKILSLGRLSVPVPPCYKHFSQYCVTMTASGRWFVLYPPGHPLMLALFIMSRVLWAAGPVLTAGTTIAFVIACERLYGRPTARACGLLHLFSPLVLLLGGSFMSTVSFMTAITSGVALAAVAATSNDPRPARLTENICAGFCLGISALIRPQDLAVLCPPCVLGALMSPALYRRRLLRALPLWLLGLMAPIGVQAFWNHAVYGSPFALGYGWTRIDSMTPHFAPRLGFAGTYTPSVALRYLVWVLSRLNKALLGWPASFLFVPFAFVRRPMDRRDFVCVTAAALVGAFYFFYPYYGAEYEARYYAPAVPFLLILTVRGLQRFHHLLDSPKTAAVLGKGTQPFVASLVLAFFLHAFFFYWPSYIWPAYAHDYEQASRVVYDKVQAEGLHNAIVLIDATGKNNFRYSSGFPWNDPLLRNDVIYARDLGGKNECLRRAFPDRTLYRFVPNETWRNGTLVRIDKPAD